MTSEHLYPTKVSHISPDRVKIRKTDPQADTATTIRFPANIFPEGIKTIAAAVRREVFAQGDVIVDL